MDRQYFFTWYIDKTKNLFGINPLSSSELSVKHTTMVWMEKLYQNQFTILLDNKAQVTLEVFSK